MSIPVRISHRLLFSTLPATSHSQDSGQDKYDSRQARFELIVRSFIVMIPSSKVCVA